MQELHNYLGLPPDTPGRSLLRQGKEHYLSLGGDLLLDEYNTAKAEFD